MPGLLPPETLVEKVTVSPRMNASGYDDILPGADKYQPLLDTWRPLLQDATEIMAETLPPVVEIVEGIIAERSKLIIGSSSKCFKTWLTMDVALSIAHGKQFLGRFTTKSRVLYVNLELKPVTFKRRLQVLADAKSIAVDKGWFTHLPLRGQLSGKTVFQVVCDLIQIAQGLEAGVVVIDPLYKLNLEGDENSSRDQTRLFNELDRITTEAGCTLILNDHFGKGNQSEKDPLDAIRGSSAKGGDVDAAMVLRKHEVEGCFRVDMVHRELPPVESFVIGWRYPLMELMPDLDPEAMKKAKPGRSRAYDPAKLLAVIAGRTADKPISIKQWSEAAKVNRTTLSGYLPEMRTKGWLSTSGDGSNARQYITQKGLEFVQKESAV